MTRVHPVSILLPLFLGGSCLSVLIIFPPQWAPVSPHGALPLLQACLKQRAVPVGLLDLNCLCYERLLSGDYLRGLELPGRFPPSDVRYPYRWLLEMRHELAEKIDGAIRILREPTQFFDSQRYLYAGNVIRLALLFASLRCWPQRIELASVNLNRSDTQLWHAAVGSDPFGSFVFEDVCRDILVKHPEIGRCEVVGFSVHTKYQLFYALRITRHLFPRTSSRPHITLGGTLLTAVEGDHSEFHPLFESGIDSICYSLGEETLALLYACVRDGSACECPGIFFSDGRTVRRNSHPNRSEGRAECPMDYTGLPLKHYLAPRLIANVAASTGCSWAKCRFCNYHERHSHLEPDRLWDCMQAVSRNWGARHFFLAQSSLLYQQLLRMPYAVGSASSPFGWGSLARIDGELEACDLSELYRAGCRKLSFGLETRSAALRRRMNKGPLAVRPEGVLKRCREEGIGVELFLLPGFPGETTRDVDMTLAFLERCLPLIDTLSVNQFILVRNSTAYALMRKDARYCVRPPGETVFDIVNQHVPWSYSSHHRQESYERRCERFWTELQQVVDQSPSHCLIANTVVRAGLPRIPEHHFLYCCEPSSIRNADCYARIETDSRPFTVGDQIVSLDPNTMTITDVCDAGTPD